MEIQLDTSMSSTDDGLYIYALHMEASLPDSGKEDSTGATSTLDPNIFVFRRSTPTMDPFGTTDKMVDDEFFNVATPVDMYDIPIGEPDIENGMPYFRDSKLDLWFRNLEDALRAKKEISADVASLARLWDNINNTSSFEFKETTVYK